MLIRTQDKCAIYNFERMESIRITPVNCSNGEKWFDIILRQNQKDFYGDIVGSYKTKERAMEILNEIELQVMLNGKKYDMPTDDGGTNWVPANWIPISNNFVSSTYKCSKCGREESFGEEWTEFEMLEEYPYCSGCGSKMERKVEKDG